MDNVVISFLVFIAVKSGMKNLDLEHKNIIAATLAISVTGLLAIIQLIIKSLIGAII